MKKDVQEAQGGPRKSQEAPGGLRKPPEAPGDTSRPQDVPGGIRRPQEVTLIPRRSLSSGKVNEGTIELIGLFCSNIQSVP